VKIEGVNPLRRILALSENEKEARGLVHTPAEIAQQPLTWQKTWRLFEDCCSALRKFLADARREQWTIFLVGAGTSDYIGYAIAPLLRQGWGCEVVVAASTDLLTSRDDMMLPGRKYLWISFSRSGDSPEGVAVLEKALVECANVRHLVVTCNRGGRMGRIADENARAHVVVLDDAVNDRSLAMTSSFTNMVVFGQALAGLWSEASFESVLDAMTRAAEFLLDEGAVLAEELALLEPERTCFVGTGVLAATAKESALKLVELTGGRVLAMSESALGLRHGPMSALNRRTIFTGFVSTEERRQRYELDLLSEVRAKDAVQKIVSVGGMSEAADYVLFCDAFARIPDGYRAPVDVIFGQMFGLFASMQCGFKPDSPSPDGVISRVVKGFTIYL
jgi:tagatose-6-phosphate ketose/aldose isomerase